MDFSPAKRSKVIDMETNVSCLVDGCSVDLSQCRNYHRRHKVCERHSKTPAVLIAGVEQRFCQQCSRFHSLEEFDDVKRSCRKRLDGHNRRRRKPRSDSLVRATETLVSNQQGTRILSYNSLMLSDWAMARPNNPMAQYNNPTHLPVNYTGRHNMYQESSSSSISNEGVGSNHFRDFQCEPPLAATNNNRALSLLSFPTPCQQTMMTTQPVPSGLDQYAFMQHMNNEVVFRDPKLDDNNGTNLRFDGML